MGTDAQAADYDMGAFHTDMTALDADFANNAHKICNDNKITFIVTHPTEPKVQLLHHVESQMTRGGATRF